MTGIAPKVDAAELIQRVITLDTRKKDRLLALWRWMVETHLCCDTCSSELATFGVEKELGDGTFAPSDKRCAKRRYEGAPTCFDKVRPLWGSRPVAAL